MFRIEYSGEDAVQGLHDFLHGGLVPFGREVEDALQAETLVGAVLDGGPDVVVGDVELREKGAVRQVLKARGVDALVAVLDVILDHLHPVHVLAVVHEVHVVLAVLEQVLLRHCADGVCLVDYVILELGAVRPGVPAVDWEVGPHNAAHDQALVLVADGVQLAPCGFLLLEGEEVRLDRRIVNE